MIEPNFVNNYDDSYTVSSICACGITTTARVPAPSVFAWRQGEYAQNAFPMLSADEREALFISGTCADCWNRLYGDEPEDEGYYLSGTGEWSEDDSYIDYLNNF